MTAQTIEQKAHTYLAEGRIRVLALGSDMAILSAKGSGDSPYSITYAQGAWACSCPAHVVECAHVKAALLITPESFAAQKVPSFGVSDPELDELFDRSAPIPAAEEFVEWPE